MKDYLQSDFCIDYDDPSIQAVIKDKKLLQLNPIDRTVKLFYFVRDEITYNMYAANEKGADTYKASSILKKSNGWCLQKAMLLAALTRAAEIPTRFIMVTIRNHKALPEVFKLFGTNLFTPHTFNEFYLNGKWVKADATFDKRLCEKGAEPVVDFDGINDALLPARDLAGNRFIEYVEELGTYHSIPWQLVLDKSKEVYGDYLNQEKRATS